MCVCVCVCVCEKIDNKIIRVEGEIYWVSKSTLQRLGSNEPSPGLWGMIFVMLNQRWMFKSAKHKNLGKIAGQEKVGCLISESAFVF